MLPTPGNIDGPAIAGAGRLSEIRLRRAMDYIRSHLAEDLSIGEVAGAVGLSVAHFSRMFRNTVGVPPRRYVAQARFELAKALIRAGGMNFTRIAAEAGFAHQSHMSNVFRRMAGMTPKAFRKG